MAGGSVVVDSLSIVNSIACGLFVFDPCLVVQNLVSFFNLLVGEEKAGCFTSLALSGHTPFCTGTCPMLQPLSQ